MKCFGGGRTCASDGLVAMAIIVVTLRIINLQVENFLSLKRQHRPPPLPAEAPQCLVLAEPHLCIGDLSQGRTRSHSRRFYWKWSHRASTSSKVSRPMPRGEDGDSQERTIVDVDGMSRRHSLESRSATYVSVGCI